MKTRNFGLFLLILLYAGFSLEAGGTRESVSDPEESNRISAVVTYLLGEVSINEEPAEEGDVVPRGATVKTGIDSSVEITFGSHNILRVEAETITTISIDKKAGKIDIQKGSIGAVFDRLGMFTDKSDFQINTPSVVAGIRGTVFYINVEKPDSTYICTCHGTVHQKPVDSSPAQKVTAYHHNAKRYIISPSGVTQETGTLRYHDDKFMEALGNKVEVEIPWGQTSE